MILILFQIGILGWIGQKVQEIHSFSYETAYENFRIHNVSQEMITLLLEECGGDMTCFSELLAMYFSMQNKRAFAGEPEDAAVLKKACIAAKKYHMQEFLKLREDIYAVWNDLEYFPVGRIANDDEAVIAFDNSWMQSRTFGGERGHEGTDIMASLNERGLYPVYSMTDGVVEKIGWLRLGGYRIGIRSPCGAYFYYAHLSEYARTFEIGETVSAGTLLGFMGDTGYSDIEGTTGNFAVHLHMGIYLNDADGEEYSINSYPMLQYLYETSVWKPL